MSGKASGWGRSWIRSATSWASSRTRTSRSRDADHAVAGDEGGQLFFAPAFGPGRTRGDDEIAHVRRAVVDAHFDVGLELEAEFLQDAAGIDDDAGAVAQALIPIRRQPEQTPRVAGTESAHHDVVDL